MSITEDKVSEEISINLLKALNWNLNNAMNEYFSNSAHYQRESRTSSSTGLVHSIKALFERYKDPEDAGCIGLEGIEQMCNDLALDASSRCILILAWKFNAQDQGKFTMQEFCEGMQRMNIGSIPDLAKKLNEIDGGIDDNRTEFKSLYKFTFDYAKEKNFKSIEIGDAMDYWTLLFSNRDKTFHLLEDWLRFCREREATKELSIVTRDQWNMLVDFAEISRTILKDYDETSAWPVLIDDFTEWYRQNNTEMAIG